MGTYPRSDTMELLHHQFGEMTVRGARESGILGRKPAPFVSPSVSTSSPLDLGTASGRGLEQSDLYNRSDGRSERSEFHSLRPEASEQSDLNYGGHWEGQTPGRWGPPPLTANTFDGSSHKVAVFLSQILNHFDLYGHYYSSNWFMIIAVTRVLVGEAYEWAADMFRTRAAELEDIGYFLAALRNRFEDTTTDKSAEGDLLAIKQQGRMAREYVNEFRRVVSKLPLLPESLLMHLFEEGLDPNLHQACLYRGSHITLNDWYHVAIELDDGLKCLKPKLGDDIQGRRSMYPVTKPPLTKGIPPVGGRGVMRCFRCDRPGHRAVDCSIPLLSLGKPNCMGTGLFNLNQLEKSGENRRKQELYTTNYWMIVMKMIVKNFQLLW
uniref:CCHC-type domain-containing protein n=1 Tax=Micrurus spixii TaxID=129469 RepID=A0A2D4N5L3_9SAUR